MPTINAPMTGTTKNPITASVSPSSIDWREAPTLLAPDFASHNRAAPEAIASTAIVVSGAAAEVLGIHKAHFYARGRRSSLAAVAYYDLKRRVVMPVR